MMHPLAHTHAQKSPASTPHLDVCLNVPAVWSGWGMCVHAAASSDVVDVIAHFCYQSSKVDFDLCSVFILLPLRLQLLLSPILNQNRERTPEAYVHHMQQEMLLLSEPAGTQEGKLHPEIK